MRKPFRYGQLNNKKFIARNYFTRLLKAGISIRATRTDCGPAASGPTTSRASFETQTERCPEETKPWAGPSGPGKSGQERSAVGGVQIRSALAPPRPLSKDPECECRRPTACPARLSARPTGRHRPTHGAPGVGSWPGGLRPTRAGARVVSSVAVARLCSSPSLPRS